MFFFTCSQIWLRLIVEDHQVTYLTILFFFKLFFCDSFQHRTTEMIIYLFIYFSIITSKLLLYVLCSTCEVGQDFTCELPSTSSYPRFSLIKQNLHQTRGAPCLLVTFECYFMTSKLCLFRVDTFIYYTYDLYCKNNYLFEV